MQKEKKIGLTREIEDKINILFKELRDENIDATLILDFDEVELNNDKI